MTSSQPAWRVFSSHGTALFYIAQHSGCNAAELAAALVVSERTAWAIIGHLKQADLIRVRTDGNRHRYWINGHARFPDPVLSHTALRLLVSIVAVHHAREIECCHPQLVPTASHPSLTPPEGTSLQR